MRPRVKILFICTGNICRSPMAEAVLQDKVNGLGLQNDISVDACGTHGYHEGETADPRTLLTLQDQNVVAVPSLSRRLTGDDYRVFDVMIVMDAGHRHAITNNAPIGVDPHVEMMMHYAGEDGDVPDPYYGGDDGFDIIYDMIDRACDGIIQAYQAGHLLNNKQDSFA